jgi:hypothetical protein
MADTLIGVDWRLDAHRRGFAPCFLSQEAFEEAAGRSNTQASLLEHFPQTNPRWYGLWIDSPLSPVQCRILLTFFSAAGDRGDSVDWNWDITVPLRSAASEGIPLYVEASPPGHSDLGFETTFVHCPRCKCEGPFPRWQESYPADIQFCECCGQAYSPASSYSSVPESALKLFECVWCGRTVTGASLTDEDLSILEAQDSHEELVAEFEWLERVDAFYRRCPAAKTFFESRRVVIDAQDRVGVFPVGRQFLAEWLNTKANQGWEAENSEVLEYLDHHLFRVDARRTFLSQSLSNWFMEEHPEVRCEVCSGKMRGVEQA